MSGIARMGLMLAGVGIGVVLTGCVAGAIAPDAVEPVEVVETVEIAPSEIAPLETVAPVEAAPVEVEPVEAPAAPVESPAPVESVPAEEPVEAAPVALDPARDVLVNVNALGRPVPSARFMGGREHEIIRQGRDAVPTPADRAAVLRDGVMLLPAVQGACGPFPDRAAGWTAEPATDGQRMAALAWYLALMTRSCLDLTGARGPVIVEGPFARNPDYLDMLAALSPEGVAVTASATGTSTGAALLCLPEAHPPAARPWTPRGESGLDDYARRWRAACQA